jgi:predicted amidohydrolase
MRLYAVTMTGDTNTSPSALNGLGRALSQVSAIEKAVGDAWDAIKLHMQSNPHPFYQSVFLAPEYYFSNQRHTNDRFFSQDVKRAIVARLAALAKKYPKFLIIPGTILWKKKAYQSELKIGTRAKPQQTAKSVARVTSTLNRINTAKTQFNTETNYPGWSHSGKFGRNEAAYDADHNEDNFNMPRYYLEHAEELNTEIAQNVAYIFKDDAVLKYHKAGNYKEVNEEQSNIVFAPGNITGLFKVGNVAYGIEICRDHAQKVLSSANQSVNIQIIISSWIENTPSSTALANGGVLLHSSTQKTLKSDNVDQVQFKDNTAKLVAAKRVGSTQLWIIDLDDQTCGVTVGSENLKSNTMLAPSHIYDV